MLRILWATSEAAPLAAVGGLADACGHLPAQLARLGHRVWLIMPAYRQVFQNGLEIEPTDTQLEIAIGNKTFTGRVLQASLPDSDVRVYLIEQDYFFNRSGIYGDHGGDYRDNCQRFVFFSRAVMETMRLLALDVDIIHVNDWTTSLIPAYLDIEYRALAGYENTASLLTIHNLSYQGRFWHWDMLLTGLDWKYFNWHQMEFFGDLNLLKTGIVFSHAVNTVSPRYAQEILTAPWGCGLEEVLRQRRDKLTGIVHGIDYQLWNPATDPQIAKKYDAGSWRGQSSLQNRTASRPGPHLQPGRPADRCHGTAGRGKRRRSGSSDHGSVGCRRRGTMGPARRRGLRPW